MVSVCIPTYRGAAHLASTIDSVLTQTFTDFELIIVDDNSPDDTAGIVARYADPRIRYLRNASNLGLQGNWNRCLEEASGKYLKLLPQDDTLKPDCLAQQVAILEEDRQARVAIVFCARDIVGPDNRVLMRRGLPGGEQGPISGPALVRRCVRHGTSLLGEPGAVLFRNALAQHVGRFDKAYRYVFDLDYWFRALAVCDAYYLPQPLASFRVWSGSESVAIGRGQANDFCKLITTFAARSEYAISSSDCALGYCMANINMLLRLIFYRLHLK